MKPNAFVKLEEIGLEIESILSLVQFCHTLFKIKLKA